MRLRPTTQTPRAAIKFAYDRNEFGLQIYVAAHGAQRIRAVVVTDGQ